MCTWYYLMVFWVMMIMFRLSSHSEDGGIVESNSWEESVFPKDAFSSPPGWKQGMKVWRWLSDKNYVQSQFWSSSSTGEQRPKSRLWCAWHPKQTFRVSPLLHDLRETDLTGVSCHPSLSSWSYVTCDQVVSNSMEQFMIRKANQIN